MNRNRIIIQSDSIYTTNQPQEFTDQFLTKSTQFMSRRPDPATAMSYMYPGLVVPYYADARYHTAYLNSSYPEHHYPLEHARHRLTDAIHHNLEHEFRTPHVEIRETPKRFYIDVELPGMNKKEDLKLKWINNRRLLVEGKLMRPSIPEEEEAHKAAESAPKEDAAAEADAKHKKPIESPSHLVIRERQFGTYARAFDFPVDVDRASLDAKLCFGVLRIAISKNEHTDKPHPEINVEHGDSHVDTSEAAPAKAPGLV
jgi:HSP20 family molecular chaperone IbpA